jgi:hypothetical protein
MPPTHSPTTARTMTYRIKRSTRNGLLKFYPQYRRWFWWYNITRHGCYSVEHARMRIKEHKNK